MKQLIFSLCLGLVLFTAKAQQYQPTWQSLDSRPIPQWYTDAKLGIFIHWGIYSVPAWATNSYADGFGSNYSEWYWQRLFAPNLKIHKEFVDFHNKNYGPNFKYQDFAPLFKAELFDPQLWAKIFKDAGAQYVVLTSKHHDGFALWPSRESWNWNAMDVGPHRDLVGDLTKAVKNAGLHMGFYYSLYEWFNPMYKTELDKYVDEKMIPQMKDLVNRYQPDIIWPDGQWDHSDTVWKSREYLTWLYNESPVKNTVVVNDRWGSGKDKHGDFTTTEYGQGVAGLNKPWEECRGIGESFGFNRNENLEQYLTSESVVHLLIDVVSRGGNLLLNIGPAADGTIPVIMQQRLKDLGDWLKVNGEAIYATTAWKQAQKNDSTIFYTKKGKTLYAIASKWKNNILLKGVKNASSIKMLGMKDAVSFTKTKDGILIKAPVINPSNMPCNYAWTYKVEGAL